MKKVMLILIVIIITTLISLIILNKYQDKEKDKPPQVGEDGIFQMVDVPYDKEYLSKIEMYMHGLNTNIKSKIPDIDDFLFKLKEYTYLHGLVNGNMLEIIDTKEENSTLKIKFVFNDPEQTKIIATIYLNEKQKYEFYHYK